MKKIITLITFLLIGLLIDSCSNKDSVESIVSGTYYGRVNRINEKIKLVLGYSGNPSGALFSFGDYAVQSKTRFSTDWVSQITFDSFSVGHGSISDSTGLQLYYHVSFKYVNSHIESGVIVIEFEASYYKGSKEFQNKQPSLLQNEIVYFYAR